MRRVVVEVSREYDAQTLQSIASRGGRNQGRALTVWQRVTLRLLSDGEVVERREMQFPPDAESPTGRVQTYRWVIAGHLRPGITAAEYADAYRAPERGRRGRKSPWIVRVWKRGVPHVD